MTADRGAGWRLRAATVADVAAMQALEVDAGRRFREVGMDAIADDAPPHADLLAEHIAAGTAWVVVGDDDRPLGYALASTVDGEGHLDQVSVALDAGRRGIGTALIERVCAWAREHGMRSVTLTTFRDVGFNGPYYRSVGFTDVDDDSCGPELAAIRRRERAAGIEVAPRVAMRRRLTDAPE
ncbi:MAG: GNAT family N-acetyltransferase [Actinobacteria bacterium]|nr:GNAT family N-acetyltransferase [Actinomycetota bacterium]